MKGWLAVWLCLCLRASAEPKGTLQERIDAAEPGAILHIPAGTYAGAVSIEKPLTLIGDGWPVIDGLGKGKTIHIKSDHVTVRGFCIRNSGTALFEDDAGVFVAGNFATVEENRIAEVLHGIYVKKANDCRILRNRVTGRAARLPETKSIEEGMGSSPENCDVSELASRRGNGIHLWNSQRAEIRGNEISEARDGIYFSFTNQTQCAENTVRHVRYGLHYMYSDDNTFTGNTFADNDAGAALMFSKRLAIRGNRFVSNSGFRAYGVILQSLDDCKLEGNLIESNAVGLSLNQCNRNRVIANRVARNYVGLRFGSNSDGNAFSANAFTGNLHPAEMTGENGNNQWALAGVGNHWDGAVPFDLDGDKVQDLPHRELDLAGPLRRDFPAVALLSDSPALKLLRFAHERAALPGVGAIVDPKPLAPDFPALRALPRGGGR